MTVAYRTQEVAVDGNAVVESIWRVVSTIPAGRVSTYGEVARLAGLPRGARQVGRALGKAPASLRLPWHRVIAAGGRIALAKGSVGYRTQVSKLRAEGIAVTNGRVRLPDFQWSPDLDELIWGPP
jgi:methylated-DNA-protein-cysteine methyltransferase-like protein